MSRVRLSGGGLDREALDAAGTEEREVLGDGGVLSGGAGRLVEEQERAEEELGGRVAATIP